MITTLASLIRNRTNSPEMDSLDPNRTIPQPLEQVLVPNRRCRALPSLTLRLEPRSRRSEGLSLGEEVRGAECWARGAEEGLRCGHRDSSLKNQSEESYALGPDQLMSTPVLRSGE